MNFFERQDQAKRKTGLLVFLFVLAMILTFLAVHSLVAVFAEGNFEPQVGPLRPYWQAWLNPGLLAIDLLAVFLFIGGGSLYKTTELASLDGDGIAQSLGGEQIDPATTDFQEKRILNIVEEMSIASGIRVPNVYILRDEPSINAFAAGFTPETSIVAVTQGSLDYLSRDELQGVIGHEFSHILNGDTSINLRLIGVLFGLEMMVILGTILFRNSVYFAHVGGGGDDDDNRGAGAAIALFMLLFGGGLVIIGLIGMLMSNIIRAAISRQREFLADASAVQYTRNPAGIAGALTKIGCRNVGSVVQDSASVETSHMFFSNVFSTYSFASLFDSHPPLDVRIKAIDPSFDGQFPDTIEKVGLIPDASSQRGASAQQRLNEMLRKVMPVPGENATANLPPVVNATAATVLTDAVFSGSSPSNANVTVSATTGDASPASSPLPPIVKPSSANEIPQPATGNQATPCPPPPSAPETVSAPPASQTSVDPKQLANTLVNSVGEVSGDNLAVANTLLASIPDELSCLVRDSEGVQVVIYALLLDDNATIRKKQLQYLGAHLKPDGLAKLSLAIELVDPIPVSAKVPVVELAFPMLRRLDVDTYKAFREIAIELVRSDGKVDIFEFTLQEYLLRELDYHFCLTGRPVPVYRQIGALRESFCVVLSFLAYSGNDDPQASLSAFVAGMNHFKLRMQMQPQTNCTPYAFSQALKELGLAVPGLKQELLNAFFQCIADDGKITQREGELIRAIAAALGCPMPGWKLAV
ncbi:MAG: M48 family metalloprotease [Planctomycetia bacterium]|nr:M48 family metalloprotease [Planctomycetia bacterium]